jgi:hypothetical protein
MQKNGRNTRHGSRDAVGMNFAEIPGPKTLTAARHQNYTQKYPTKSQLFPAEAAADTPVVKQALQVRRPQVPRAGVAGGREKSVGS